MSTIPQRLAAVSILALAAVPLAAPADAGDLVIDGTYVSTAPSGTPPLAVSSTTRVDDLNSDLLDGLDASQLARSLGNVVRVGKTSGDFTSIQAALDSITTASAVNPFLVRVGPGVFEERVTMKPFVDIEGAGEGITTITRSGGAAPDHGTVVGADDAELRFVTVVSGGGPSAIGVYNKDVSPRLRHVTVRVTNASASFAYGIFNEGTVGVPTEPVLSDVTVSVIGVGDAAAALGVLNQTEANTRANDLVVEVGGDTAAVKYGIYTDEAAPVLQNVSVDASSNGPSASIFGIVNDQSDHAVLRSVLVVVEGGGTRYGLYNALSTLELLDLEVRVSGSSGTSYGIFDEEAVVEIERCTVEATGGATTYGLFKYDSSGALRGCTLEASGGSGSDVALLGHDSTGQGSFTLDLEQSRLEGDDGAASAPSSYAVRAGASRLEGGVGGGATYTCVASYDGSFAALSATCT